MLVNPFAQSVLQAKNAQMEQSLPLLAITIPRDLLVLRKGLLLVTRR
jgi:hypothetical protein